MASNRRNSNDANGSSSEGEEPNSETQQVIFVVLGNLNHNQFKYLNKFWIKLKIKRDPDPNCE